MPVIFSGLLALAEDLANANVAIEVEQPDSEQATVTLVQNQLGGGIAWPYPLSARHWSAPRPQPLPKPLPQRIAATAALVSPMGETQAVGILQLSAAAKQYDPRSQSEGICRVSVLGQSNVFGPTDRAHGMADSIDTELEMFTLLIAAA